MNLSRKILFCLLLSLFCILFAACGGQKNDPGPNSGTGTPDSVTTEASADTGSETPTDTDTEAPTEAVTDPDGGLWSPEMK